MHVAVDEAGQDVLAGDIDPLGVLRDLHFRSGTHGPDRPSLDQHGAVPDRRAAVAIDDGGAGEGAYLRVSGKGGDERAGCHRYRVLHYVRISRIGGAVERHTALGPAALGSAFLHVNSGTHLTSGSLGAAVF
jgi:hypothetical protein